MDPFPPPAEEARTSGESWLDIETWGRPDPSAGAAKSFSERWLAWRPRSNPARPPNERWFSLITWRWQDPADRQPKARKPPSERWLNVLTWRRMTNPVQDRRHPRWPTFKAAKPPSEKWLYVTTWKRRRPAAADLPPPPPKSPKPPSERWLYLTTRKRRAPGVPPPEVARSPGERWLKVTTWRRRNCSIVFGLAGLAVVLVVMAQNLLAKADRDPPPTGPDRRAPLFLGSLAAAHLRTAGWSPG